MPDFVFDTSAFINGWNFHYRLPVFQGVWDAIGQAMADGVVLSPSEVLIELEKKSGDELHTWATGFPGAFQAPSADWSPHFGLLQVHAPHWFQGAGQHDADPFVVAMAMEEKLPVMTYEGQAFNGTPAQVKVRKRSMPIVCAAVSVPSVTMFEVLDHLGVMLH